MRIRRVVDRCFSDGRPVGGKIVVSRIVNG